MAMHGFGIPWNGVGDRIRQIPTYHKYLRVCICNYTDLVFFTTNVTFRLWMGAQRVAHRVFFLSPVKGWTGIRGVSQRGPFEGETEREGLGEERLGVWGTLT